MLDFVGRGEDEVVRRLLAASSSIGPLWQEHLDFWQGERAGEYNDVALIARHAVHLAAIGDQAELQGIFDTVEELLGENLAGEAREILVTGLLEDIQNLTSHSDRPVGSSKFVAFLGPRTLDAWRRLHVGWGSEDT
jgi:hypothetical protein